jgi:hypothetical protein
VDLSGPTWTELVKVLAPMAVVLVFWLASGRAVRDRAPLLRDALIGLVALVSVGGLLLGSL